MDAKIIGTRKLLATPRIGAWKGFCCFRMLVERESTTVPCIFMTLEVGGLYFEEGFLGADGVEEGPESVSADQGEHMG